ncbi:DUF4238 domain-containing protein [Rhodanobacter glycinis]|nr:DUF4238 domain-containing protein [Rhodanobacter glycinis]
MTEAKIQHYVPKFHLRNFGLGKKDQLWVYDKQTARSFQTNAKNVASENRFYDFEIEGETYSLESSLSQIESKTKPVIERILHEDSVSGLGAQERATLGSFLASQFVRTKAFRMQWADLPRILRDKVASMGSSVSPGSQAEALIQDPSENQIKVDTTRMLLDAPLNFGPRFLDKIWFVAKTTNSNPFILGDNPVSLQNQVDMTLYGNLGLAVRGIEIYLPLSSTRALAMWCPSLAHQVGEAAKTINRLPPAIVSGQLKNPDGIIGLDSAPRNGSSFSYEPTHVMNFNSLQVARSERYLFSSKNDFSLAQKMIDDHPDIRSGQRLNAG